MDKQEIIRVAMEQMARDNACKPEDFLRRDNLAVVWRKMPGRRLFSQDDWPFNMLTFGHNTVISCNRFLKPWCDRFLASEQALDCFKMPQLLRIERRLRWQWYSLASLHEYYMPVPGFSREQVASPLPLRLLERQEIPALYGIKSFRNALSYDVRSTRPDVLAVAAMDGETVAGLAGCAADSDTMWQIGIDVLPAYREKGLATALVTTLSREILRRGKIPYYCTWASNIGSRNTALASGFFPAWTEVYALRI